METLKIALISSQGNTTTPPQKGGGLEQVVYDLGCALLNLGHDVTLIAPRGSSLNDGDLIDTIDPAEYDFQTNGTKAELDASDFYLEKLDGFDIIHDHSWNCVSYAARFVNPEIRVCHTHHGHAHDWNMKTVPDYMKNCLNFFSISDFMKKENEGLGIASHRVYNGIDLDRYEYCESKGNRLLFVGRFNSFKQPHAAISAAIDANIPIDIVASTAFKEPGYTDAVKAWANRTKGFVKLYLDAEESVKVNLMKRARACIMPSALCIPKGNNVICSGKSKDISEVIVGDSVISHDGKWHRVMEITSRDYVGKLVTVRPYLLNIPLALTPNHRIYSSKRSSHCLNRPYKSILNNRYNSKLHIDIPEWIPIEELKVGDYITIPIPESEDAESIIVENFLDKSVISHGHNLTPANGKGPCNKIPDAIKLTPDNLRLLGYYIAEGSCAGRGITFSFGYHEQNLVDDTVRISIDNGWNAAYYCRKNASCIPVIVHSSILADCFGNLFGRGARSKKIPDILFNLPPDKLRHLIRGMWEGDGCKETRNGFTYYSYSTASHMLAIQVWMLLTKFGIISQLRCRKQNKNSKGKVKQDIYEVTITGDGVKIFEELVEYETSGNPRSSSWSMGFIYENYIYLPIRKLECSEVSEVVYNLEVEDSHSFMCQSAMVHNSEPYGLVALESMSSGTPIIVTRDGALPEVVGEGPDSGGFVCNTFKDIVEAVRNSRKISQERCRKRAEMFSRKIMAENYVKEYRKILDGEEW